MSAGTVSGGKKHHRLVPCNSVFQAELHFGSWCTFEPDLREEAQALVTLRGPSDFELLNGARLLGCLPVM